MTPISAKFQNRDLSESRLVCLNKIRDSTLSANKNTVNWEQTLQTIEFTGRVCPNYQSLGVLIFCGTLPKNTKRNL